MKNSFILIVILCSLSCKTSDFNNESLSKESNLEDTINTIEPNVVFEEKEYLESKLNLIRKQLQGLKNYDKQGWSGIDKRKAGDDLEEGHILNHYLYGELRKLTLVQFDSLNTKRNTTTIYMEDTIPFFANKREFDSLLFNEDKEWYEPFEDSIFFENGEVIRIKSSGDCGASFSGEYLMEEEVDIKAKIKLSLDKK